MNQLILGDNLEKLKELVERFSNNIEVYKSSKYDESNTRTDFIDKLFVMLGWDVSNESGFSEDFREVIREDKVVIKGRPKAPDYSFRTGRERQFFVEAKKPSVKIFQDIHSAFQLRRYAYTAGLPISILTNFEEFAIYDTNVKPKEFDNASVARIFYCKYTEYEKHWEFLNDTISKKAVWQGKLKKYTTDNTKKKGTQTVDKELLNLIEIWRFDLAKNIALRTKELDIYQLNEAVQTIIDRIIFLRMAEDRNTEIYGFLQTISGLKEIYNHLVKYFDSANKKYNSGLFATIPWLDDIKIDDKIFKTIIHDLYYPMPYEFSVLPIEILGQIYEQFLGKTIVLSNRHVASVEEKPEVRKAGGVYYTPKYIVDYIVENTVGKKIENKHPKDIESLTILDPACGSGSFLVGAYKFLLNYHIDFYINPGNIKRAVKEGKIYEAGKDDYRLTIREKKKILLNNIYGVDIDKQAVEVTKLSLLLTLMEGEIVESRGELFLKSLSESLLPSLDNNVKCGNSLIGSDFYSQMNMEELDNDYQRQINCFDWEEEFPQIFNGKIEIFDKDYFEKNLKEATEISKSAYEQVNSVYEYAKKFDIVSEPITEYRVKGGFDVVIGNPPYVLGRETFDESVKNYISMNYKSYGGKFDLYVFFTEKALSLLKDTGKYSFIIPNTILANENATNIRQIILKNHSLETIRIFKNRVFENAQVETVIIVIERTNSKKESLVYIDSEKPIKIFTEKFLQNRNYKFNVSSDDITDKVLNKVLQSSSKLGEFSDICIGIQLGGSQGNRTKEDFLSNHAQDFSWKKVLDGKDINSYSLNWRKIYVHYGNWLHRKRDEKFFINPKILIRQIGKTPIATLDENNFYTLNTLYNIITINEYSPKYLLAIINSKLGKWFWLKNNSDFKTLFPKIKKSEIEAIPIHKLNFSIPKEKAQHDRMVNLVELMLETQKVAHDDKNITETDKKLINQRIKILDKQIDILVYELYGLTEEEIHIVEG